MFNQHGYFRDWFQRWSFCCCFDHYNDIFEEMDQNVGPIRNNTYAVQQFFITVTLIKIKGIWVIKKTSWVKWRINGAENMVMKST